MNVTYPASGIYGNQLQIYNYANSQWTDISHSNSTTNGNYTINNLTPGNPYYVDLIWYTDGSNSWLQRQTGQNVTTLKLAVITNTSATSITVNVVYPGGSGTYGNGLYYCQSSNCQMTDVSHTWNTTNGNYTINNLKPSTQYFIDLVWYTDPVNNWQQRTWGIYATTQPAVAELSLYASADILGSSYLNFGHSFLTVKNISNSNINIGAHSGIAPGKQMSLGTWGNKSEHTGLWYNLEEYFYVKQHGYTNSVSLSTPLTSSQFNTFNSLIPHLDSWSNVYNCSSFTTSVWNLFSPVQLYAGNPNLQIPDLPSTLMLSIMQQNGYVTGKPLSLDYAVYYAQGTGTPKKSTVYK
jgi:hypothetical protein